MMNYSKRFRHCDKGRTFYRTGISVIVLCSVFALLLTSCVKKKSTVSGTPSSQDMSSTQDTDSTAGTWTDSTDFSVTSAVSTDSGSKTTAKTPSAITTKAPTTATTTEAKAETVRITIPEGYSLSQIGDKLEKNKVCTKASFLATVNSYQFSSDYTLINRIPAGGNRCYRLEGYLYPDTYDFYIGMKPQDVIGRMIRGAQNHIEGKYSYSGMTTDQIITMASIIEKEAAKASDMQNISAVLHNRLKIGWQLGCDATIYYIERYVKPNLSGDINRYNSYYNTYKCPALPAGPICSPGANALYAACHPTPNADYLYFWSDSSGYHFSKSSPTTTTAAAQ